jgi:hypothetical protein
VYYIILISSFEQTTHQKKAVAIMMSRMLEVNFKLNNCGQKAATVGIRIGEKFIPELYLCRHPSVHVGINFTEFQNLKREESGISSFFEESRDAKKTLYLSDELRVKFDVLQPYGKVVIFEKIGSDRNTSIYYVRSTWQRLVCLLEIMNHHLIRLTELVPEIEKMVKSLAIKFKNSYSSEMSMSTGVETIQKILSQINYADHINKAASNKIDWFELYQHIKHFCPEKILIALKDIEVEIENIRDEEDIEVEQTLAEEEVEEEEKEEEEEEEEEVDAPPKKIIKKNEKKLL